MTSECGMSPAWRIALVAFGWVVGVAVAGAVELVLITTFSVLRAAAADSVSLFSPYNLLTPRAFRAAILTAGVTTAPAAAVFILVTQRMRMTGVAPHVAFGLAAPALGLLTLAIVLREHASTARYLVADLTFMVTAMIAGVCGALAYWLVAVRPQIGPRLRQPG